MIIKKVGSMEVTVYEDDKEVGISIKNAENDDMITGLELEDVRDLQYALSRIVAQLNEKGVRN